MSDDELRALILREVGNIAPEIDLDQIDPASNLYEQVDLDSMDMLNLLIAIHGRRASIFPKPIMRK